MDWRKVLIIAFLNVFGLCQALFETCDQTYDVTSTGPLKITSPEYPSGYYGGTTCRYTIRASTDSQIQGTCSMNLNTFPNGSASTERLYYALDGQKNWKSSTVYWGYQTVSWKSQGNQMVIALISTSKSDATSTGIFNCTFTTICDCGWSISSRIVGGDEAGVNEFTSMAGLVADTTDFVFCGATIVSTRFAATAAHCIENRPANQTKLVAGEHDVATRNETSYTAEYRIDSYIVHPNYTVAKNLNDICLIKTKTDILYSRAVSPACLPFFYTSAVFTGENVTATGWGTDEFGGLRSDVLRKVVLTILSNTDPKSQKAFPNMTSSQMCAYAEGKDTCQLDSGGPLWFRTRSDPRLCLIGLVSAGKGCATEDPSMNTRVTSFLPWIEQVVGIGILCRRALQP